MNPIIIIDFDAIRREIYEDAIESNTTTIDEKYIKKCFLKNLISLVNILKIRVKICYKKDITYDNTVNFYCDEASDLEFIEIEKDADKVQLLLDNEYSVLIDDYDLFFKHEKYDDVKYRILLLKRGWNLKNIEKYFFMLDTKDNSMYVIDLENKLTMSFPKYISLLILKN
jgi:hypothetical protein